MHKPLGPIEVQQVEKIYTRATNAELVREYDSAFRLYVEAAESFLYLSRSSNATKKEKEKLTAQAGKALERAEKIKAFVSKSKTVGATGATSDGGSTSTSGSGGPEVNLTPVDVNPFSFQEQFYVLRKGGSVNGVTFALWDETPSHSAFQYADRDNQPSLSPEQRRLSPIWRRPRSYFNMPASDLLPQDILQHVVTDCSVCASISVCLEHSRRFSSNLARSSLRTPPPPVASSKELVTTPNRRSDDAQGQYDVKLLFNGAWRRTAIDDKLPYHPTLGTLICMSIAPSLSQRNTQGEQEEGEVVWPSLIEKGYMKLMGGYDFLGSNSSIDLHALAGWIPEHIETRSSSFEREKTWERIINGFSSGQCMLTIGTGTGMGIRWRDYEFLTAHSYAVIDVIDAGHERDLIILDSWLPLTNSENQKKSSILRIPWSDILDVFDGIYLSWDPRRWTNVLVFHGMWNRNGEGEKSSNRYLRMKFNSNSTDEGDEIWLLLTRHIVDTRRMSEYIALRVLIEDDISPDSWSSDLNRIAVSGTYTNSTHVLVRMRIPSSQSSGALSIFPSYDGQSSEVGFTLTVYANSTTNIAWDEDMRRFPFSTKVDGTLTSKNAGGNCTYPTFMANPQYHLRIHPKRPSTFVTRADGKANVVLTLQTSREVPINVTVVWSQGERIMELAQKQVATSSGAYSYGIARAVKDLPAGDYSVILSAFEPHHMGSFSLKVECSLRFDLKPIQQEGAGMYSKTVRSAWDAETAAGGPSFKRYSLNPRFEIDVPVLTQLKIRLQLIRPSAATSLNVTLYPPSRDGSLGGHITTSGSYDTAISGVATPQVTLSVGKYWIIPSTYNAGVQAPFQLTVYSTTAGVNVTEKKR